MKKSMSLILSTICVLHLFFSYECNGMEVMDGLRVMSGNDIVDIHKDISVREYSMKRGEFESTKEYKTRIEKEKNNNYKNFIVYIPTHSFDFKYNIDKNEYVFNGMSIFDGKLQIDIHKEKVNRGEYIGENSFGVKRKISVYESSKYTLNIINLNKKYINKYSFNFSFKIDTENARKLKDNIVIAFDVMPIKYKGTYCSYNSSYHSPQINEPYESEDKKYTVNVKLMNVYVFNRATGEKIAKINIK